MFGFLKGFSWRRTKQGFFVRRVHYSSRPDRGEEWATKERPKYTSQGTWDREQEIIPEAGAGERVFAEVFRKFGEKIVIDPDETNFQPSPYWKRYGGFDHGKSNPTAALVGAVDQDGVLYIWGEYYQPELSPREHKPNLESLNGFMQAEVYADPSIFYQSQAQVDDFKAVVELYIEEGITNLIRAPYVPDATGMLRILKLMMPGADGLPRLRIVCPREMRDIARPMYGVHNHGCPNLLWELRRTRREEHSPEQLNSRNPSEKIVDKDNHLRDCLKYLVAALPQPEGPTPQQRAQEAVEQMGIPKGDLNSRIFWVDDALIREKEKEEAPRIPLGRRGRYLEWRRKQLQKEREQERQWRMKHGRAHP